jgi:DNA invertase Pin-like site-specific DNA recombinase
VCEINVAQLALSQGSATLSGMGHLLSYARVSTTDQQPHLQVDALQRAGCYRVFTETASGARSDRPTLAQVLDQLRPGDTLVVWKLDRLGRSLRHLVDTVTGLAERAIGFRSLQEAIDTTTPGGKLVFHVFAALAEFERDLVRERTSAGLAAARARGRQGGRPSVMTTHKVRVAQQMYRSGQYTVASIATTLGVSRASVYRHLGSTGNSPRGQRSREGRVTKRPVWGAGGGPRAPNLLFRRCERTVRPGLPSAVLQGQVRCRVRLVTYCAVWLLPVE